jgi:hypothetical protein
MTELTAADRAESLARIRVRWSLGSVGGWGSSHSEQQDQLDVQFLLDEIERLTPQVITTVEQIQELNQDDWLLGAIDWPNPKPQLWPVKRVVRDPRIYLRAYGPFTVIRRSS